MAKYTDKFKAIAIATLEGAGYPDNPYKLEEIAKAVGVPSITLRRWFNADRSPDSIKDVREEKKELSDLFENIAHVYLGHAATPEIVEETRGKDAIMAAAIAVDKMQLLRGLPTEIIGVIPELVKALQDVGLNPSDVFNSMLAKAVAQRKRVMADATGADSG